MRTIVLLLILFGVCGCTGNGAIPDTAIKTNIRPTNHINDESKTAPLTHIFLFEFDSSRLNSDYAADIKRHAQYLIINPSKRVLILGHSDDKGTKKYNNALGMKRSLAVKKALINAGVDPSQLFLKSVGKAIPLSLTSDFRNRRVTLIY